MIDFAGHVTLVTGAGRGLGRAYARLLAERGATVIVHDAGVGVDGSGEDPSVADAVVAEIRDRGGTAEAAYEDLGERAGCRALVERVLTGFGKLDALVHSAGLVIRAPIEQIDEARWRRSQSVNVDAAFWLLQAVVPGMRERRYGRIVLTTSGYGLGPADDVVDLVAYCSTKAAQYGAAASTSDASPPRRRRSPSAGPRSHGEGQVLLRGPGRAATRKPRVSPRPPQEQTASGQTRVRRKRMTKRIPRRLACRPGLAGARSFSPGPVS